MAIQKKVFLLLLFPLLASAQYTDVINSNRPGVSVSAYAVGKNVVQAEVGLLYEIQNHSDINYDSNIIGGDLSLRYGLLLENLELNYEGSYINQNITFNNLNFEETRTDFRRNRIGLKYLLYDPFKNPEASKPNLYSWRANNKFQWKNLIPAVSVYGGATFNLGDNPFYREDATISYRGMVALQSLLSPRFVLISNIAYDRITTDFPELSYTISLSHALRNPKWSVFVEHQGIDSDRYSDLLLRGGIAHLFSPNFQVDVNFGGSFKTTPSRILVSTGLSYRLDFHKDELIQTESDNTGKIKKKSMKKKRKKKKKKNELDF
ncbi:transporter [Croceitalea sp. MTPC9]|uniref:transporter n=1 Tax=unclassified Croceitalea TaxID=2632280 RepID=UPI002B366B10|nr:transporter [Croceitalea sp. MTPC6]GMN15858.1 transporter [Croceitalea sp. MTPC9]